MTCCDYGKCINGPDCPVRKQRIKEVNDMYIRAKEDSDPYTDTIGEFKTLLALLAVIAGLTMLAFAIWGRP